MTCGRWPTPSCWAGSGASPHGTTAGWACSSQQALAEALAGRTSIVIAHRLSTVRAADMILVVEDGRIVERGTHDQLLARGGRYAELYHTQFGSHEDVVAA